MAAKITEAILNKDIPLVHCLVFLVTASSVLVCVVDVVQGTETEKRQVLLVWNEDRSEGIWMTNNKVPQVAHPLSELLHCCHDSNRV